MYKRAQWRREWKAIRKERKYLRDMTFQDYVERQYKIKLPGKT